MRGYGGDLDLTYMMRLKNQHVMVNHYLYIKGETKVVSLHQPELEIAA
jgi:hypothetical protein